MFFREISRILGRYLIYFTLILCIPLGIAITYDFFLEPHSLKTPSTWAFVWTIAISLILSLIFLHFGKKAVGTLYRRESIVLVALMWFITAGIGAIPFWYTKTLSNPLDAYFESMSGLTTTGATIIFPKAYDPKTQKEAPITIQHPRAPKLSYSFYGTIEPVRDPKSHKILYSGIDSLGKGLLFWRSFLQWLGGMGIVVLFIAVLPALSMGGKFLFETEMPGPNKETITPRIRETASLLWKIYLGLTVLQIILLMVTNKYISLFDAVNLSLTTISTGGFTIRSDNLAAYHQVGTQVIVMIFMILGSINFSLYFHCIRGKIYRIYEPEFLIFLFILICASFLLALTIWNTPQFASGGGIYSFSQALATGSFQAVSAQTSTGFAIGNYDLWPFSSQLLLLILIFIGGMSGSTCGGMKVARLLIVSRSIAHKIESIFRPDAVRCLKIGNREISDKTVVSVLVFFSIMIALVVLGTFLLVVDGIDPQTSFGVIACMINNAGLIFGGSALTESCAFLPTMSKIVSILWMALGRLEFFALLVLLVPAFWNRK